VTTTKTNIQFQIPLLAIVLQSKHYEQPNLYVQPTISVKTTIDKHQKRKTQQQTFSQERCFMPAAMSRIIASLRLIGNKTAESVRIPYKKSLFITKIMTNN
jgi:RecB family endonuclease NucS